MQVSSKDSEVTVRLERYPKVTGEITNIISPVYAWIEWDHGHGSDSPYFHVFGINELEFFLGNEWKSVGIDIHYPA